MKRILLVLLVVFTISFTFYGCSQPQKNSTGNNNDEIINNDDSKDSDEDNSYENQLFHDEQGLTFYPLDDGTFAVSIGYAKFLNSITFPSSFRNKIVTKIVSDQVVFANSYGNNYLKNVSIPNSIKEIDDFSFELCTNITEIIIPDSVVKLGDKVFYGCSNLETINLSNNLQEIGEFCFSECKKLNYNTKNGLNYIGSTKNPYLVLISLNTNNKETYEINKDAKFILENVFVNQSNLKNIKIPKNILDIKELVFSGCENLIDVDFEEFSNLKNIGRYAFSNCYKLENVSFSENIISIGDYAFQNCYNLKLLHFPKQIKKINEGVFSGNYNLNLILEKTIEQIEASNFNSWSNGYTNTIKIYFKGKYDDWQKITKSLEYNNHYHLYFYSETESPNCWHYDTDNITPILW